MSSWDPLFHTILFQPEIPNNTGNIGRTCVAMRSHLHLIGPLGFSLDEKSVRRAGLDYWKYLHYDYYENLEEFMAGPGARMKIYYLTTKSSKKYTDIAFEKGVGLMYGPETRGLPAGLREPRSAQCFGIPMLGPTRSLNLSNAVAIVGYEALRQIPNSKEAGL